MQDKIEQLRAIIQNSRHLCVFSGAGISVPSGIPDFRSASGLYNQPDVSGYAPEQIISHSFFEKHTELFYRFYREKMIFENARPNAAHLYFAQLEQGGKDVSVVTQNIDGLHRQAGSKKVYEIHGTIYKNHCLGCGKFFDLQAIAHAPQTVPHCDVCGGIIKPDVVLYEESLDDAVVQQAVQAIHSADTLLVIGTSLSVYPAASFLQFFGGSHLAVINKTKTSASVHGALEIYDDIVHVIDQLRS